MVHKVTTTISFPWFEIKVPLLLTYMKIMYKGIVIYLVMT